MEKIAVLLPRQTILEHAERVLEQEKMEVQFLKVVENRNAVAEAQAAAEAGARVIIARGLQATLIKASLSLPVVEMPMTVQDIGMMVLKAKYQLKKDHPTIGIVAFRNMFSRLDHLEELFDFKLQFYELGDFEETRAKVSQAIAEGVDLIIGGVKANQTAFEIGFPSLFMETGEESFRNALDMAIHIVRLADMEKHNEAQMATLLDTSFSGIIKINAYQEIVAINRVIEQLLGCSVSEVAGFPIGQVIPGIDVEGIEKILSGADEMYSTSFHIGDQMLMVIGAPIQYDGHFSGAILTCHKIKTLDKPDDKASREKLASGHIARRDFSDILRTGEPMKHCIQLARSYAISGSPVLLCGETGTEKEILAESIHNNGTQKGGPFLNINCGTLSLQEQREVIFGIYPEEGRRSRKSAFESAAYGTLFLQEVDRLSDEAQYLLYKAIRDRQVWRNGSLIQQVLAVRVVASVTEDVQTKMRKGTFREELYYLLSALRIDIPPLRSRPEDIVTLAEIYLKQFNTAYSRYVSISPDGFRVMKEYAWSGNLIQLEAFCERLILTAHRRKVEEGAVQNLLQEMYPAMQKEEEALRPIVVRNPEAVRMTELLEQHGGNRNQVAEELGISTTTLWRKMKKYGIGNKYGL